MTTTQAQAVHSTQPYTSPRQHLLEAVIGTVLLCAGAFLLQGHYGFSWADEGLLWYNSQRTAVGGLPLRDFYSYDPGRYYWAAGFFHLLGNNGLNELLIANAAFGALGLAAVWFAMCRAGIEARWRIVCAVLMTLALGFPRHKIYEQSLSLIAAALVFYVLLRPSAARRWLIFGIATGVAAFIGRNSGVYFVGTALLCVLILVCRRALPRAPAMAAAYIAGIVAGYLPMLILVATQPGFMDAFVRSVLFLPNWQLTLPIPFPWRVTVAGLSPVDAAQRVATGLICLLVPILYATAIGLAVWRRHAKPMSLPFALFAAASCAGIPYLYQAFDRADFGHIANGILPAFPAATAAAYAGYRHVRHKWAILAAALVFAVVMVVCWLPYEPLIQFRRAASADSSSVSTVQIDGHTFHVFRNQAETLDAVKKAYVACHAGPDAFMAAPHFPGVYAFLHAKAPFWELYYLYPRPPEFQKQHIAAIAHTRLILLAPDATVDNLERLKLRNTYGLLMDYIDRRYMPVDIALPDGYRLYALPGACH